MLVSVVLTSGRVLSRIFCLGGGILKHVAVREKFFGLSRGVRGYAPSENFENIQCSADWLKSHFWIFVTFTDSLKSLSKKIFI